MAEMARKKEAAREADRQKQKEALKQQKLDRAKHAMQVKVGTHLLVATCLFLLSKGLVVIAVLPCRQSMKRPSRKAVEEATQAREEASRAEGGRSCSSQVAVFPDSCHCRHSEPHSMFLRHGIQCLKGVLGRG